MKIFKVDLFIHFFIKKNKWRRVLPKQVNKNKEDPTYDIKTYLPSKESAPSCLPISELQNRINS